MYYSTPKWKCNEEEEELCFYNSKKKRRIIPILHWSSSLSIPTEEPKKYSIVLWRFSQWCPIVLCWETFFEPSIWSETKNLCVVCKTFMKPKNCNVFKICNVCDVRRLWKRIKNPRTTTLMLWKNYFWAARVACFTYDYAMESRWKKTKQNYVLTEDYALPLHKIEFWFFLIFFCFNFENCRLKCSRACAASLRIRDWKIKKFYLNRFGTHVLIFVKWKQLLKYWVFQQVLNRNFAKKSYHKRKS